MHHGQDGLFCLESLTGGEHKQKVIDSAFCEYYKPISLKQCLFLTIAMPIAVSTEGKEPLKSTDVSLLVTSLLVDSVVAPL